MLKKLKEAEEAEISLRLKTPEMLRSAETLKTIQKLKIAVKLNNRLTAKKLKVAEGCKVVNC